MEAKAGDYIKVKTKEEEIEGIMMPQEKEFLVVKLGSGYNIGIDKRKINKITVLKKHIKRKKQQKSTKPDKKLSTISILHTGGTIASKVDYETGGVIAKFTPEDLLEMFPEIKITANIKSRLVANMWSEDMRFSHYNLLAKQVEKEVKSGIDGIIITHGTDTLHYTSAALSFMLENLPVPVILVGAQRSSDRGSSDAATNLISAALFIANSNFSGVAICMHENSSDDTCLMLSGLKSRKMHSSRRDAFRPINTNPIAKINFKLKKIDFMRKTYEKRDKKRKLKTKFFDEKIKVGVLKMHPHMYSTTLLGFKGFAGVVLEGTGLGHAPINVFDKATVEHKKIADAIKTLIESGTVVAMSSQTTYGRIDMNVYSTGRKLQELGVIGNLSDMTPETAFIKLAWLLSNYKKKEATELFIKNLMGEISERTEYGTFLV